MMEHTRRAPNLGRRVAVVIGVLLLLSGVTAFLRLRALDYDVTFMTPATVFDVDLIQTVDTNGDEVSLKTFLPSPESRQRIFDERNQSGDLQFTSSLDDGNRVGIWRAADVRGKQVVTWSFRAATSAVRYEIDPAIKLGAVASGVDRETLEPTKAIQSTAPEVTALAASLVPPDRSVLGFLRATFDRVQSLGFKPFKGTTDALTALRLGEASCNGRGRLMAALARSVGLPARLVGGLVLENGSKRTSHQWVEVWLGGHWVPFDPTNHHFAEIPYNYLALYRGDHVLFKHTSDLDFRYSYVIKRSFVPRQELEQKKQVLGFWAVFAQLGIPLDLLKVIIMIPLGSLVVVIFRNVIGLRTFGVFLPVLIAVAARATGYWWGILGFSAMILFTSLVRRLLEKLELLHTAQLAVLLTTVIGSMLLLALGAERLGLTDLAKVTLFPVAIMALTSERFAVVEDEEGRRAAWMTLFRSLVAVGFCYLTISSLSLQILMLGFPELLLAVIAADIWLGRWIGMRATEWLRFKGLLRERSGQVAP